ncbi:hypothetical protein BV25DRAFT_781527 [Artomyces pyxidatus]|uniref:Uncharacterized protein n=1 Tax=Artomyces pyxidatus TaxID=48021 RepID=A0ACB8SZM3_9AGAM|nr:hypothetical protein BV25DRAFT_781527 [Artomyces pyxidatus]
MVLNPPSQPRDVLAGRNASYTNLLLDSPPHAMEIFQYGVQSFLGRSYKLLRCWIVRMYMSESRNFLYSLVCFTLICRCLFFIPKWKVYLNKAESRGSFRLLAVTTHRWSPSCTLRGHNPRTAAPLNDSVASVHAGGIRTTPQLASDFQSRDAVYSARTHWHAR